MNKFAAKEKRAAKISSRMRSPVGHAAPANGIQHVEVQGILRTVGAQAKLTIGQPNGRYEQEADRVADQVMRMSDADVAQRVESGTIQPMQIQRTCPACEDELAQRQPVEDDEDKLQTNAVSGQVPQVGSGVEARISSLMSGGTPLDRATRNFFEPRFGYDFGNVRVHHGGEAASISQSINARAFTLGNHMVFGPGLYNPESGEGRKLLGHELTHVAQQRGSTTPEVQCKKKNDGASKRSKTSYKRINMLFNGDELIVYGDDQELTRYGASSGRPILISEEHARECGGDPRVDTYMSPRFTGIKNNGPIPEGTYRFSPSTIQEFSASEQSSLLWAGIVGRGRITVGGTSMHSGDWGAGRVHLKPVRIGQAPCGNPKGRGGFYLHGGLLAGSSGCIDIGTSFDDLARLLRGYRGAVTVEVRYKTETPRVGFFTGLGGALAYSGFHFRHGPVARLGIEFGPSATQFVASTEYQLFLDWAGGALSAGLHVDVPMNDEEAFIRAGLKGGAEFRLIHALYGQLSAGGFVESARARSAEVGAGWEVGGGLSYDFGRPELSLMYNYLKSSARGGRHQILLGLGFHW